MVHEVAVYFRKTLQSHRESPFGNFGNSQELLCAEFSAGIPGNFLNSGGNYGRFIEIKKNFVVDYHILT